MKSYSNKVSLNKYKEDYANELTQFFASCGKDADAIKKYVDAVLESGYVDDVYTERLEGWESGPFDKFYLDINWDLHILCFPDW